MKNVLNDCLCQILLACIVSTWYIHYMVYIINTHIEILKQIQHAVIKMYPVLNYTPLLNILHYRIYSTTEYTLLQNILHYRIYSTT